MTRKIGGFCRNRKQPQSDCAFEVEPGCYLDIDWSKYGRGKKRQQPRWEVTYEGNGRGDGIRITAVFEPENLDAVVASIRRQMEYWATNQS